MKLVTEYLIIVDRTASEAFYHLCDKVGEFNKLLQTDSDIAVEKNTIKYKNSLKLGYEVKTNKVEGKEQRFFHVKVTFDGDDKDVEEYTKILRSVRGTVHRAGGQPETLWDDVSLYYSYKAYPLIHKIENLMRKLIAYFMLTTVGKEWVAEASPVIVREAIDKSKRKQYLDVLHQIDFIHLGDFLFKAYQTKDVPKLFDAIIKAKKLEDLNLDDLKGYIGKSNWERYFSKFVACSDEYLDKRWKQLYDLRCMVAHNVLIGKSDYDKIVQLVSEVEEYLQKAIDNIDKVHVPKEDREQVAENVASNISVSYGDFLQLYRGFEKAIVDVSAEWAGNNQPKFVTPVQTLRALRDKDIIDDEFLQEGLALIQFRNRLVHDANSTFTEQEIRNTISRLEEFISSLTRSWKDEIINALKALGGEANLAEIYDYIENNSHRNLPKTWQATIRYTLQLNSSDTVTFKKGGTDLFQHLSKGRWGLRTSTVKADLA
jgi:uncharacterized protein YutE (UPF0331/DUF86 family)